MEIIFTNQTYINRSGSQYNEFERKNFLLSIHWSQVFTQLLFF